MRFGQCSWTITKIFFLLLASCACENTKSVSLKSQISLQEIYWEGDSLEICFDEDGIYAGEVVIHQDTSYSISIRRRDGSVVRLEDEFELIFRIAKIGTVDLEGDGDESVFVELWEGGTGGDCYWLSLISPRELDVVGIWMYFSYHRAGAATAIELTDNFENEDLKKESNFLNRIKYEYGYIGVEDIEEQPDNPEFAYYFWVEDNAKSTDGKMKIRKYKGAPSDPASINAQLQDRNMIYRAYFKSGVIAYDEHLDEHFVLFLPKRMYNWPIALAKHGPYLFIGTAGEGLAVVNVENYHLKRFDTSVVGEYVDKIEIVGSKVRINDETYIDLPSF